MHAQAVDNYIDAGGHVARFAGNFWWQIRIEGDRKENQICVRTSILPSVKRRETQDFFLMYLLATPSTNILLTMRTQSITTLIRRHDAGSPQCGRILLCIALEWKRSVSTARVARMLHTAALLLFMRAASRAISPVIGH